MVDKDPKHTTNYEIEFLNELGSQARELNGFSRLDLLRGYLRAIAKRTDWTGLDRDKVIHHARQLLHKETLKNEPIT